MRQINNLNISESVRNRKLIFSEKLYDKFDRVSQIIIFTMVISMNASIIFNEYESKFYFMLVINIIAIIFSAYIIYRKATEKNLRRLNGFNDSEKNYEILLELGNQEGLEIFIKSKNCLIFNEPNGLFSSEYKTSTIILLEEKAIYFTMIQDGMKMNIPVLFSHLFLESKLKKIISSNS